MELARKARRESGIDRTLISLSALGSRELLSRIAPGAPVAVVGSGCLAASVARYLKERGGCPIRVAGRCPENAISLAAKLGGFGTGLDNLAHLFDGVAGIVSATAAPHPVIYAHHLVHACRPLTIIDLAAPADCSPEVFVLPEVSCVGLSDIEAKASANLEQRKKCAEIASRLINDRSKSLYEVEYPHVVSA